jgi:hypothetical protein
MRYNKRKSAGDRDFTQVTLLQRATEFTDVIFEDLTLTAAYRQFIFYQLFILHADKSCA